MYYTKDLKLTVVDEDGAKELYKNWNDYYGRACCDSAYSCIVPETWDEFYKSIKEGGLSFLVRLRDNTIIGYASINVAHTPQIARPYLFIVKEHREKGYGVQLMAVLMYIAFEEVNARKMSLAVYGLNNRAIHLYTKMGFNEEGRQREEVYRSGNYFDVILMGLFRKDWREYWKSLVQNEAGVSLYTLSTLDMDKPAKDDNHPHYPQFDVDNSKKDDATMAMFQMSQENVAAKMAEQGPGPEIPKVKPHVIPPLNPSMFPMYNPGPVLPKKESFIPDIDRIADLVMEKLADKLERGLIQ